MKNIFIALPNDSLGGAEQYLKMIATHYLQQDYNVYVFFLKKESSRGWEDIKCSNLYLNFTSSRREIKGLMPFIVNIIKARKIKFDMAFTSHIHLNAFVSLLLSLRLLSIRYLIGRESTSIFSRYTSSKLLQYKFLYKLYLKLDLLICQTDYMKKQLVEALPSLERKVKVVVLANPVDLNKIKEGEHYSQPIDLSMYGDFIVSAGRLIPEKGFDILIEAFKNIVPAYPYLKLVILGEGKDRKILEEKINEAGLEKKVILAGFVKNVYPYFKSAKLSVVSSRIEGFPNVLLQMMSQNHKVVSTKCAGGIDDIPGIFAAETHSVSSLEQNILAALETDTSDNRNKFDKILSERSIESFIKTVEGSLK